MYSKEQLATYLNVTLEEEGNEAYRVKDIQCTVDEDGKGTTLTVVL